MRLSRYLVVVLCACFVSPFLFAANRELDCSLAGLSMANFDHATVNSINLALVGVVRVDHEFQTSVCRYQGSISNNSDCRSSAFSLNNEVIGLYNTAKSLRENPNQPYFEEQFRSDEEQVVYEITQFQSRACGH